MDPISAAITAAVTAGVTDGVTSVGNEAIVDTYRGIKNWIENKVGKDAKVTTAIAEMEQSPDSKARRMVLAEEITNAKIADAPELLTLAHQLINALRETPAGRQAVATSQVDAGGAQEDVTGDLHPVDRLAQPPSEQIGHRDGRRRTRAGQKTIIAPQGGYELVWITGGEFLIGSPESEDGWYEDEGPQHTVRVPDFYLGRYPVTNEEYGRFLSENSNVGEPVCWADTQLNHPRQPVVGVSWEDARQYAQWAGLQLPSEAQWEYACRAGTQTCYYTGDSEKDLDRAGWYFDNSGGKTHTVGQKEPNAFGLFDMHGNVKEWVEDDWHDSYQGAPDDGSAWVDDPRGAARVIRGGAWVNDATRCRAAYRGRNDSGDRYGDLGFRLALSPGQKGEPGK